MLLLLFGWGLALNLTPCVYPVIPLTVSFFGGQAQGQSRRTLLLASVYVLGMATMYSALGVAAALSGRLFGAALQSPWVLGVVALVLVGLALSMFGLYDIRMPTALMQKAGARQGVAGAYGMGLLVGVVAAPCVGPVVLGLLAFVAATQDAVLGFLFFFVLALGLGLPFLVLAAFSGRIAALPRAGAWMDGVKKVFGWILLAMAAYFVRNAIPGLLGAWLLPAILVVGALALLAIHTTLKLGVRAAVAVLFLAAALFFAPMGRAEAQGPGWAAYEPAKVASARTCRRRRLFRFVVPALHRARQEDVLGSPSPRSPGAPRPLQGGHDSRRRSRDDGTRREVRDPRGADRHLPRRRRQRAQGPAARRFRGAGRVPEAARKSAVRTGGSPSPQPSPPPGGEGVRAARRAQLSNQLAA